MATANYTEVIVNAFKILESSGNDYIEFEMPVKKLYTDKDMVAKFVITTKMYEECEKRLFELKREFTKIYWNGIDIDSIEEYISHARFMPVYCTCDISERIIHISMKSTLADHDGCALISHPLPDNITDIDDILKGTLQSSIGKIQSCIYCDQRS